MRKLVVFLMVKLESSVYKNSIGVCGEKELLSVT